MRRLRLLLPLALLWAGSGPRHGAPPVSGAVPVPQEARRSLQRAQHTQALMRAERTARELRQFEAWISRETGP